MAEINFLAVLVAGVVAFLVGALWYSPKVCGSKWLALLDTIYKGKSKADIDRAKKKGMTSTLIASFILTLIMAHVMAYFVAWTAISGFWPGVAIGFFAWAGFSGAVTAQNWLYLQKPWTLWAIETGHNLIVFMVLGGILAAW